MERPSDLKQTGRVFFESSGTLAEMVANRRHHLGIQIDRGFRDDERLVAVNDYLSFLAEPGVKGLRPLVWGSVGNGKFLYETGPVWPLRVVLELTAKHGSPAGVRAGMEMMVGVSKILESASVAFEEGPYSHGGLNPWRIVIDQGGNVQVIGYGIPQVGVGSSHTGKVDVDAYRYAPPERLDGEAEDLTSDQLALALMGFELMLATPLYDGDVEDVHGQAQRAVGRERLHRFDDQLEWDVIEALETALERYPDARYRNVDDFSRVCAELAESPLYLDGMSLADVMAWVATKDDNGPADIEQVIGPEPEPVSEVAAKRPKWEAPERSRRSRRAGSRKDVAKAPKAKGRRRIERSQRELRPPRDRNAMFPRRPRSKETVQVKITLPNGQSVTDWLDREETLAESAARVIDAHLPSPISLTGWLQGWYRIVQGDEAWYGSTPSKVLDAERPIELEFIENRTVKAIIRVEDENTEELEGEVGTAVHGAFLLSELCRQLSLQEGVFELWIGDRELGPWQVLDDFDAADGLTLTLRNRRRGRSIRR
jgi:hypothetical protein